jgi:hypothetical protein
VGTRKWSGLGVERQWRANDDEVELFAGLGLRWVITATLAALANVQQTEEEESREEGQCKVAKVRLTLFTHEGVLS